MIDPVLSIQNLQKSFGALKVSDDISFDLRAGEIHALIGPNGAGKSTLIKQIAGGIHSDNGSIHLLNEDITELTPEARVQKGLARTFQVSSLIMDYTVLQNVVLGALGASQKRFGFFRPVMNDSALLASGYKALKQVGLDSQANVRTGSLSHGERRQLEVAVALTLKPKAFLMDEPMAGLGEGGAKYLVTVLDKLREEAPILLIEHDMDAVFYLADRISVLVYGQIITTGTVSEIQNNPDVRRAYLGDEEAL